MATVTTWTGVTVSIQSALATAVAISGISKADPGVVTHASGAQSDGAFIVLDVEGMTQLDGRVFRVDNPTSTTLELEDENTTSYSTFSSGSFQAITFGTSLTTATGLTASGGEPNFIDVTTIHDTISKQVPGNTSAATYSFESIWDVSDAGLLALQAASNAQSPRAVKFTFRNGQIMVFNGYVSATLLPIGNAGDKVTTSVTITMFGLPTVYAS